MAVTGFGPGSSSDIGLPRLGVANSPVGVGQSVSDGSGGVNSNLNKDAFDIGAISPNINPQQALDGPNPAGVSNIYRFPGDTPPYYMMLPICKYSRASWSSVGQLNEENRIILPLPREMIDNHNVRYAAEDIGIAGSVGFDALGTDASAQSLAASLGATAGKSIAGQLAGNLGLAGAAGAKAFNGVLGATGLAVNDFMTIMLKGPDYKKRDFIWRFSPKTAQETFDLRRIIQLINNSMAPSLFGLGSAFFSWPKIWKPQFVYNGVANLLALQTFKMKASVLTDASFNYTPNGNFSPFASTKAPTSIEMRLSFWELEFWLAGDFSDNEQRVTSNGGTSNVVNNIVNANTSSVSQFFSDHPVVK